MVRVARAGSWRRFGVALVLSVGLASLLQSEPARAAGKRSSDAVASPTSPAARPASAAKRSARPDARDSRSGSASRASAARRTTPAARSSGSKSAGTAKAGTSRTKSVAKTRAKNRRVTRVTSRKVVPARPSIGHAFGLHDVADPLSLESAVALVLDQRSGKILFEKNSHAVLPIASISKLMTAVVVLEAALPMNEMLEISAADVDTERNTTSRLRTGTRLSRGELLHLALMSSENRAANALGRHYPGGLAAFVARMNDKAAELGMEHSNFVEPTGLSSSNVSSARDLALLVQAAFRHPLIREYSTASALSVDTGYRTVNYRNTNRLIGRDDWEIGLQKTGFISEAGNCLVMQARIDDRPLVFVLLDAQGRRARIGDANRIRNWLERTILPDLPGGQQHTSSPPAIDAAPDADAAPAQTSA